MGLFPGYMHGGTSRPKEWYTRYKRSHLPINFGASFFYTEARESLGINKYRAATDTEIRLLAESALNAIKEGALGISFSLEYVPGITRDEVLSLAKIAKDYHLPVFFHARYSTMYGTGTNIDAINELIGYAEKTGISIHIDHINSTGGTFSMKQSLKLINDARSRGAEITASVYPYTFWATYLNSARFDPGWQERFRIGYGELQLGGSSERLTEESFLKYRAMGKLAVAYAIPEEDVIEALKAPYVMIGSEAILEDTYNNHPRASGTFARTIGYYSRDKKVISLMEAIAKMTILPAVQLERASSLFKKKGRISPGADADITIFDYDTITDTATVEHPEYQSIGIEYVIVGGKIVKDKNGVNMQLSPGKGIKNDYAR